MIESLPFAAWETYYVIIGSSAAALTGLNFVVIALSAESRVTAPTDGSVRAFATPTTVHFGAVLLISAILSAPWPGTRLPRLLLDGCGVAGILYLLLTLRHAQRQSDYKPVLEDWIWHFILPFIAYGTLLVGGLQMRGHEVTALFMVASSALLMLFVGIHNAWDSVVWMATRRAAKERSKPSQP
jgi:hypothetical protein